MPLGKEVGLGPGHIVLDGDPAPTAAPPHFRPMPIVAKRSPISATAEVLQMFVTFCVRLYIIHRGPQKAANLFLSVTLSKSTDFNAVFTVRFRNEQYVMV